MKITIIGCGWLGLPLLESLVKDGHTVWGTSRSDETLEAIASAGGKAFRVDLPKNFFGAVFGGQDLLIITLPPGGRRLGAEATESYLAKLRPLAGLLKGKNVPHVIYTSSTGVYGAAPRSATARRDHGSDGVDAAAAGGPRAESRGAVDEQRAVSPATHSGHAVVAAENWLGGLTDRLTILRLAGLIGPGRHPGTFYGCRDRPVAQADAPVNLVHRDDVIAAVQTIITNGLPAGVFNVCAAAHPTKGDFYEAAAKALGKSIAGREEGGKDGKVIASDRLRALGWEPEHDSLVVF